MGKLSPKERELLGNCLYPCLSKMCEKSSRPLSSLLSVTVKPNEKALENRSSEIFMLPTESNLAGLDISELMNRFTKIMSENSIIMPEGVYLLAKVLPRLRGSDVISILNSDIAAVL